MTITTNTTIAFRIPEDNALQDSFIKTNDISNWRIIQGSNCVIYKRDNTVDLRMIDPVRKGKWIDKHAGIATCSECGDRWGVHSVMKFCPSCGAKMEEPEDIPMEYFESGGR